MTLLKRMADPVDEAVPETAGTKRKWKKPKKWGIVLAIVLAVIVVAAVAMRRMANKQMEASVTYVEDTAAIRDITNSLTGSGTLQPANSYSVTTLVEGEMDQVIAYINREAKAALLAGKRVGIICTEESRQSYSEGILEVIGSREHEETVAHNLFAVLRDFDDRQVDFIFSESFSKDHMGQAIMNRLCKAAGYHIVNV